MEWMPERECRDGTERLGYSQGSYAVVQWLKSYWSLTESGKNADDGEWWPEWCCELPAPPKPLAPVSPTI